MVAPPPRRRRGLAQKPEFPANPRVVYFIPRGSGPFDPARAAGLGRLGWGGGRELECDVKPH
eukprot:scaffold32357_cov53-Phaeocystis_antarctica.AAC.6